MTTSRERGICSVCGLDVPLRSSFHPRPVAFHYHPELCRTVCYGTGLPARSVRKQVRQPEQERQHPSQKHDSTDFARFGVGRETVKQTAGGHRQDNNQQDHGAPPIGEAYPIDDDPQGAA